MGDKTDFLRPGHIYARVLRKETNGMPIVVPQEISHPFCTTSPIMVNITL